MIKEQGNASKDLILAILSNVEYDKQLEILHRFCRYHNEYSVTELVDWIIDQYDRFELSEIIEKIRKICGVSNEILSKPMVFPKQRGYKYIRMEEGEKLYRRKPVYDIFNKETGGILGDIRWDTPLKRYVFRSYNNIIWAEHCLNDVIVYLSRLNN
jgi:hypothetical protein